MASIRIEISGPAVDKLRHLAQIEQRSEEEIVRAALEAYQPRRRSLPKGAGKYHSGRSDGAENVEAILSDAVKEGRWP